MAVDFQVGSLADLISGNKQTKASKRTSSSSVDIKFETIKKPKMDDSMQNNTPAKKKKIKKNYEGKIGEDNEISNRKEKKMKRSYKGKTGKDKQISNRSSALRRVANKSKQATIAAKEHEIFVGNVPCSITKQKLINIFQSYGEIESVRLRGAPLSDPRIPKKVAIITKKFHSDRRSMHAYVRFVKIESAKAAIAANGTIYEDHHLRVDLASNQKNKHDIKKAVFLGNVPFAAEEDDLWNVFQSCGAISSIRIVRDGKTGVGKGFAYINFEDKDAVELALQLDGQKLKGRALRVRLCDKKSRSKHQEIKQKGRMQKPNIRKQRPTEQRDTQENDDTVDEVEYDDEKDDKFITDPALKLKSKSKIPFQGQKVAEGNKLQKKKKKMNKEEINKMSMVKKISSNVSGSKFKPKRPFLKVKPSSRNRQ